MVAFPDKYPKSRYSQQDMEELVKVFLTEPDVVSSVITENEIDWIITTTYQNQQPAHRAKTPKAKPAYVPPISAMKSPVPATAGNIETGIKVALRANEIGNKSPYQLSYAANGKSGASFGFMQGDLAAGPKIVKETFAEVMQSAGMDTAKIALLIRLLSRPLLASPLPADDSHAVNAALDSAAGQVLVDKMDGVICGGVLREVTACVQKALAAGKTVDALAQIYMALWINMSGRPTTLLHWLSGNSVSLTHALPAPGPLVDGPAMLVYLRATEYFTKYSRNLRHMITSAEKGEKSLII
jgi:hypothetical protein